MSSTDYRIRHQNYGCTGFPSIQKKALGDLGETIERVKDQLKIEKVEIERKLELFSMGFYASLTAAAVAIFGLLFNLPTVRLDRRLKMLEIEEKELVLDKVKMTQHKNIGRR